MRHTPLAWLPLAALSLLAEATSPAVLAVIPSPAAHAATHAAVPAKAPTFDSYWHDGKAEMDGYRYSVTRYGETRRGECAAIYVTEPFSRSKRVKADDPGRNPADSYDVLKLNLVRDFQTGIYDYDTMTSLFVRSDDFEPVKISFASMEWCGNVYEEIHVDPRSIKQSLSSYFEGESAVRNVKRPAGGLIEEELHVLLRGLRGEYLRPGETKRVPFLPSAFHRRLKHLPLAWSTATIERLPDARSVTVPAGRFSVDVYVVKTADRRIGRFEVERVHPRRLVSWEWRETEGTGGRRSGGPPSGESTESGRLAGSKRLEYWKLHANGDERYLEDMGLRTRAR